MKNIKNMILLTAIIVTSIILIVVFLVRNTDTLYDTIMSIIYFSVMIGILGVAEWRTKNNTLLLFVFYAISYMIIFFSIRQINKHLLVTFNYLFIIIMLILNIRSINKRNNRKIMIGANIIGVLIVCIMFCGFSEPYKGRTKQEYIVMNYLLENEGYKREEILEIIPLSSPRGEKEKRVFVKCEDKNRSIYYYKYGEIIQIKSLNQE